MSRLTNDFSTATMNAIGEWKNIYKMPRENNGQFRIANPAKLFSKSEGKIDIFRHTKAECVFHQYILTKRISKGYNFREKESDLRRDSGMKKCW